MMDDRIRAVIRRYDEGWWADLSFGYWRKHSPGGVELAPERITDDEAHVLHHALDDFPFGTYADA
jgi:hypothetical protein